MTVNKLQMKNRIMNRLKRMDQDVGDMLADCARMQIKLNARKKSTPNTPPKTKKRSIEREFAIAELQETLGRKSIIFSDGEHPDNEIENELAQIKMKLNSAGRMSKQAAKKELQRTLSLLHRRRS